MTSVAGRLSKLAQACYDRAKAGRVETRVVAEAMVSGSSSALRDAMAVEWLVTTVAKEQRAAALTVERASTVMADAHVTPSKEQSEARVAAYLASPAYRDYERQLYEEKVASDRRHAEKIAKVINDYAQSLKVKWTAELMASTFALADGSVVTWGEATLEQHQERYDMFAGYAQANAEGAARHAQAIQELNRTGARTLVDAGAAA